MDELTTPVLRISRSRLIENIDAMHARIAPSQLMLVMKDDAYGHGVEQAVDAARAATTPVALFGGYDVATSVRIRRRAGADLRIFAWATSDDDDVHAALEADIDLGVGTAAYLRRVIALAVRTGIRARLHLKIDTGLHRNGFLPEEWRDAVAEAARAHRSGAVVLCGVWSHLAEASDAEDDVAAEVFRDAVDVVRGFGIEPSALHLTASAASWWRPELRGTVSRIGAFCYGIRSADGPLVVGTTPIAALEAPVVEVDDSGDSVAVRLGFLDGMPSRLAGISVGTPQGAREVLRIGETITRVRAWPGAAVGDVVHVFGPGVWGESDATALAERIGTVGEEILTRISPLVPRSWGA